MTAERYSARVNPQKLPIAWDWCVVDGRTNEVVEYAQGLGEDRARRIAQLLNQADRVGVGIAEFDGTVGWDRDDRGRRIAYLECDRLRDRASPGIVGPVKINGTPYECVDVISVAGRHSDPARPILPGEPIGLVLRELWFT